MVSVHIVDLQAVFRKTFRINHAAARQAQPADITQLNFGSDTESVFALLKRGIHGVYHHTSPKHLRRYVDEFSFRLGDGDVGRHTIERIEKLFSAAIGRRITYAELIA